MSKVPILAAATITVAIGVVGALYYFRPNPAPPPAQVTTSCGTFASVEQLRDYRVRFKICAPNVDDVQVIEDSHSVPPMTKDENGLFTGTTTKALKPDFYRYYFLVHGIRIIDPLGKSFTENLDGGMGLFEVKGPEISFTAFHKGVPHGALAELEYHSASLDAPRRLHVYTPPGYQKGLGQYPVIYLMHGTGDNDDTWGTIGRVNAIMDNAIASGQAAKMIVVMPAGHVPIRGPNAKAPIAGSALDDDFGQDLVHDIVPLIDNTYRTIADPDHRAIAGLSMGGSQAVREGVLHPELFHYIGIFSASPTNPVAFESKYGTAIDQAAPQLKLVYYALGKTDGIFKDPNILMDILNRHGVKATLNYSGGGHEWSNWRSYFNDFVQLAFR